MPVRRNAQRAAFKLLEAVGRFDCVPPHLARLLTWPYVGIRQTSDLDCAEHFVTDFESALPLALPAFANSERLTYFTAFVTVGQYSP